ncbi:MAG: DNA polymerase I [Actinobacteria bacterium]|nr:DNA polymerase I [Actinomycetota bacterium]
MSPAKSSMKREKILLLDGMSLAFRAFYALPEDLQTTDGTYTNAVYGFTSMLIKVLQDEKPEYIATCFDLGEPLKRTEEFSDYKATRTEAPSTFGPQVPLIREVLKVMAIPIFEMPGHEADDLIAYLAHYAKDEDLDVRIVTGDRDFFQCVNDRIHVLYNRRGISDIVEMDPDAVIKRYGVPPGKYVDLKALEGDNSDNLPGVPGVGTKTAAKLVQKYGSAEDAVAHADEQTPKLRANLASHGEQVALNKKLSTLVEVPLEGVNLEDMRMGGWDREALTELFNSLEFRSLLERLLEDFPEAAEGEGEAFELELRIIEGESELQALAEELDEAGSFAIDLVPTAPRRGPRSLALSWADGATAYVPFGAEGFGSDVIERVLGPVLGDPKVGKLAHGARGVVISLDAAGLYLEGLKLDTHIAAYLLDPGASTYSLDEMARRYTGRELQAVEGIERQEADENQAAFNFSEPLLEAQAEDSSLRALAVAQLAAALEPEMERLGMRELYEDIEHPLVDVLARMEKIGVKIDLEYLDGMATDLDKRISKLEAECYEFAGERINLGSPKQLRELLYEKLGLKTTRRTKSGLSTDQRALQQLVGKHPFVQKLIDYRELAKLKNTYIDALPPLVDPNDGRVHTTYDQTVAATGRLSSTNPNLMNIPIRSELGAQIRRAFVPEEGHSILSVDYSQIELRVMAHLSEDPILVEVFNTDEDIHTATALRVFDIDPTDIDTRQRSTAKMINYGLAYGMGAPGLADRLNIPVPEAQDIMDTYFERFDGVAAFLDQIVRQAHADGFTTTMFGRRRYLPELGSGNPRVRAIGERQALNAPIQGTAADIMKLAMIGVDQALQEKSVDTKMILTVHDELVFEVPTGEESAAAELIEREMTSVAEMKVPLRVESSFGPNWAEAKG